MNSYPHTILRFSNSIIPKLILKLVYICSCPNTNIFVDQNNNNTQETPKRTIQRSRSEIPMSSVIANSNTQPGLFQPTLSSRQIQISQPGATQPKINRALYWGFKSMRPLPPAKPPKLEQDQKSFSKRASISGYKKKKTRPASSDTYTLTEAEKVSISIFKQ